MSNTDHDYDHGKRTTDATEICPLLLADHDAATEAPATRSTTKTLNATARSTNSDQHRRYDPRPEIQCRVCFFEELDSLILPCLHVYACYSCLLRNNVVRCDLCDRRIVEIIPMEIHHAPKT